MGSLDDIKSILNQSALDAICEKFHISRTVHPDLPGLNSRIRNSPTELDLFAFCYHADPTKVRIRDKEFREGEVEESDHVVQDEGANIVRIEDEVPAFVFERAKGSRKKRKAARGASGSSLPLKN
nr:hypothetical protein [Tanacetum cinerariifolium]